MVYLTTPFGCLRYVTLNGRMVMNDELGVIWKEEIVAYFRI